MTASKHERELGAYYDEHGDDEGMWGEPVSIERPERLDVTLSVRFSRAEIDAVRSAAETAGKRPTAFIREAALGRVHPVDVRRLSADLDGVTKLIGDARQALGWST